ncbi:hypothetical protein B0H17DRAFT_1208503 [Mycena rosella]|uniref:Uncharacterized protein n=1 Tax=Mycena rosella TaxID=1033263 RepID=A0AAD7D4F9_MYCRO|nr:hypothetical protein B0H17DRAFT_1208503 [Mycena rosella]
MPHNALDALLNDTRLAASEVHNIANAENNPTLATAAAATVRTCQLARGKAGGRDDQSVHDLVGLMHETVCALLGRHKAESGALPEAILEDSFLAGVECKQRSSRLGSLFKRKEGANQMNTCIAELRRILERLLPKQEGTSARADINSRRHSARLSLSSAYSSRFHVQPRPEEPATPQESPTITNSTSTKQEKHRSLPMRAPQYGMSSFERWRHETALLSSLPTLGFLKYVDEDGRRRVHDEHRDILG